MAITSKIYSRVLRYIIKKSFPICQKMGFHVTLNHFYEPVPDTRTLKNELWSKHTKMIGVKIDEKKQIDLLSGFSSRFKDEYKSFPKHKTKVRHQYHIDNSTFGVVDGEILYCMIRRFKPSKVFEVGSGYSTFLAAQAILKNREDKSQKCDLVVFDPYPNDVLKAGFPGLSQLITTKIQDVPLMAFNKLKKNDILFIDSSHVLNIGSDVQYEYLEVLPRLNEGVIIHIHDIFLPSEYPKEWVLKDYLFWTEQYMLQAFLTFNNNFEILWSGSYMSLKYPEKLEEAFSSYNRTSVSPGSFWIRKKNGR